MAMIKYNCFNCHPIIVEIENIELVDAEGPPICVGWWNVNNPHKLEVIFPIEHSTLTVGSSQNEIISGRNVRNFPR